VSVLVRCGAVEAIAAILRHSKNLGLVREACWALSNVTAGTEAQIQAVLDCGVFPTIVSLLGGGLGSGPGESVVGAGDFGVRKEASWAISNAVCGGNEVQVAALVDGGCIPPLCSMLNCQEVRMVRVALDGIDSILKVGKERAAKGGPVHGVAWAAGKTMELSHGQAPGFNGFNVYAQLVDECRGLDAIEALQTHPNDDTYEKAMQVLDHYFGLDPDPSIEPAQLQSAAVSTYVSLFLPTVANVTQHRHLACCPAFLTTPTILLHHESCSFASSSRSLPWEFTHRCSCNRLNWTGCLGRSNCVLQ
jgi:hypothetical protein